MSVEDDRLSYIVYLPNPEHNFHGNHWYHMGEYYLSRMHIVQEWLSDKLSTVNLRQSCTIYLVSQNALLHRMLTHFTFFFLVLMSWSPLVTKIHLVLPSEKLFSSSSIKVGSQSSFSGRITYSFEYEPNQNNQWRPIPIAQQVDSQIKGEGLGILENTPISTMQWLTARPNQRRRLQRNVQLLCPQRPSSSQNRSISTSNANKKLLFYQRDQIRRLINLPDIFLPGQLRHIDWAADSATSQTKTMRSIPNGEKVYRAINRLQASGWEVDIIHHHDERGFCELYHMLNPTGTFADDEWSLDPGSSERMDRNGQSQADATVPPRRRSKTNQWELILVTSHGFQLAALFLLPPHTTVIEIFPYKYFKPSYFPLYEPLQLKHRYFQSQYRPSDVAHYLDGLPQEYCLSDKACRSYARNQDIYLLPIEINLIRHMMAESDVGIIDIDGNSNRIQ